MNTRTASGTTGIQAIDHTTPSAQTFHKFEYAYDKVHNRRMEKNSFNATWMATLPAAVQTFLGGRNGKGDVYAYDMAYRLVDARYDVTNPLTEVQSPCTQAFVTNIAYTLDGLGNRSQVQTNPPTPPASVTYAADVVNQYTSVGGVTRTHDNNGNLKDDGSQVYGYDFENRLVEVRQSGTQALIATYQYDAIGRRVQKVVAGGSTTRYVLDGVEVVEEFDASGVWQARYVYEDGIDRPRCMDRADIADVNGNSNTTEVLRFHYHQQALGSVTEITQPTGAVVEWVTYDAYGRASLFDRNGSSISQSAVGSPYLFTGREYDPESGLYHYRARGYDANTGRFLQRDPLGFVDGLSAYSYVHDSPCRFADPHGLSASEAKSLAEEISGLEETLAALEAEEEAAEAEVKGQKAELSSLVALIEAIEGENDIEEVRKLYRKSAWALQTVSMFGDPVSEDQSPEDEKEQILGILKGEWTRLANNNIKTEKELGKVSHQVDVLEARLRLARASLAAVMVQLLSEGKIADLDIRHGAAATGPTCENGREPLVHALWVVFGGSVYKVFSSAAGVPVSKLPKPVLRLYRRLFG